MVRLCSSLISAESSSMSAVLWSLVIASVLQPGSSSVSARLCSEKGLSIVGGNFSLSDGYNPGSVLTYECPPDQYAYPTLSRRCRRDGRWFPLVGRQPGQCRLVTCPDPSVIQHGSVSPSQRLYFAHNVTSYECFEGYQLLGSASRTCLPSGKWSGATPICNTGSASGTDRCPDPGVPPGARRSGSRFGIDDKVTYQCDRNLILVGSRERVCGEGGEWTGTEPACYYKYTYDSPEEAASAFASSLSNVLEESGAEEDKDKQYGKKIRLDQQGKLNIYVALDTSDSLKEDGFEKSKNCILKLIEKISDFEVTPKYDVVSFATFVKEMVSITDPDITMPGVMQAIQKFKYSDHGDQTGTNIAAAFRNVYEKMSFLQAQNKEDFKETRHVIILFSDGRANMGGSAEIEVNKIRNLVSGIRGPDWLDYLDIYAFGVGDDIDEDELIKLVSEKPMEKHFFKIKDITTLEETFDTMIDESDSVGLCGLYRNYEIDGESDSVKRQNYPWLVTIKITRPAKTETCMGSLISKQYVLTAAHCFQLTDEAGMVKVLIDDNVDRAGFKDKRISKLIVHPEYNIGKKEAEGIPEFYDYDVALIRLEKELKISRKARPICIPCTKATSRALGLSDRATCREHEGLLLEKEFEPASFMSEHGALATTKNVKIKLRAQRDSCVRDALQAPGVTATDPEELVTESFLCTGGIHPEVDDITCKGDSGGALFLERKRRLVQVGVISWGNKNLCDDGSLRPDIKPRDRQHARDYYISLFRVTDFLRQHLEPETPDVPSQLTFVD